MFRSIGYHTDHCIEKISVYFSIQYRQHRYSILDIRRGTASRGGGESTGTPGRMSALQQGSNLLQHAVSDTLQPAADEHSAIEFHVKPCIAYLYVMERHHTIPRAAIISTCQMYSSTLQHLGHFCLRWLVHLYRYDYQVQ